MEPIDGTREHILAALLAAKARGLGRLAAQSAVDEVYPRRLACGFEVYEDWTMPEPPIPGAKACVQFHGGDGLDLFWWHPEWSRWPKSSKQGRELGEIEDPLVNPDTGGYDYKLCEEAYAELGFTVV